MSPRFGNDSDEFRTLSAKQLATTLHFMQGTPYIYQGEEIGMTNVKFDSIEDYRDGDSIRFYEDMHVDHKRLSHEEAMQAIYIKVATTLVLRFNGMLPLTVVSAPRA